MMPIHVKLQFLEIASLLIRWHSSIDAKFVVRLTDGVSFSEIMKLADLCASSKQNSDDLKKCLDVKQLDSAISMI